jgi:lipoprotein-releasing system permease protein
MRIIFGLTPKKSYMNLPLNIARRYIFGKKNTNAINIITGIAVFGLTVGTAAMVLVLSVFNGFEDLISGMYSDLNPDILVTPKKGKTFELSTAKLEELQALPEVAVVARTVEEKAVFDGRGNQQTIGILKGVDDNFQVVTQLDSSVREGRYLFQDGDREMAVLGYGMRNNLNVDVTNPLSFINVYTVKKKPVGPFEQPFRKRILYPAGTFYVEPEFNNNYILSSLDFAQRLLQLGDQIGALEIQLSTGTSPAQGVRAVKKVLGEEEFRVQDRYAQNESFLKLMQVEKWMSFAIVSLMLLLVAFNLIGALWMIVLEKRKDIAILKSMGATDELVRNIFLNQGLLLSLMGILFGFLLALLIFFVQKQFQVIGIPGGFAINAYPISLRVFDFLAVALTVAAIGFVASIMPARRAKKVPALIQEE